jgi:hypothetical protein
MYTLSKKHIGYVFGAMLATIVAVPLLIGSAQTAHAQAQPLTADELFGGTGASGSQFAAESGLGSTDLIDAIQSIIRVALGFLGIIAVIIILLGGFKWMTAAGEDKKVEDAKKLIYSGIIGLVIVLSAFAIASFVINQITGVTGQGSIT